MRERTRQTYTSLEIGLMQEENEQLKRRLEKAIEYIEKQVHRNQQFYEMDKDNLLEILKGEEEII